MTTLACFKAYDIRGQLGSELNEEIAYRIGRAFGCWLLDNSVTGECLSVVLGGDIRLTSESLKQQVANGLLNSGVDVIDLGMTGTEEVYFATFHADVDGGEMSAHHYFRDFAYCDSGMIPWLLIIGLLSVRKQTLSSLFNERVSAYPSPGEINFRLANPQGSIAKVRTFYEPLAVSFDTTDGISFEFKDWRFNLRSSNTEPVVRLNLETREDQVLMREKLAEVSQILEEE